MRVKRESRTRRGVRHPHVWAWMSQERVTWALALASGTSLLDSQSHFEALLRNVFSFSPDKDDARWLQRYFRWNYNLIKQNP